MIELDLNSFRQVGGQCCGIMDCSHMTKHRTKNKSTFPLQKHTGECPAHVTWLREHMFEKCPSCKLFFLSADCRALTGTAVHSPNQGQGVIYNGARTRQSCWRDVYDAYNSATNSNLALTASVLVESDRPKTICPKELSEKMLNVGCFYGEKHVPSAELAKRRATMESLWARGKKGTPYVLGLGRSNRDYATLIKGMQKLSGKIHLQILARVGKWRAAVTGASRCPSCRRRRWTR